MALPPYSCLPEDTRILLEIYNYCYFDTDNNPDTGYQTEDIGAEYWFYPSFRSHPAFSIGTTYLYKWTSEGTWSYVGSPSQADFSEVFEASLPLSEIGLSSGASFKIYIGDLLLSLIDFVPDEGYTQYVLYTDNFRSFPFMFLHGGLFSATVAIGANWPRGPSSWMCDSAATIDVIGATLIVNSFIPFATSTEANIIFDSECSLPEDWTDTHVQGLSGVATGDLIAIGGPGINLVWRYYDGLEGGGYVTDLPVIFKYEVAGPYIYVRSTGAAYRKEGEWWSGSAVIDYAILELYEDAGYGGRPVLLVAGISGVASRIACEWLNDHTLDGTISTYECQAIILRINDADSDPFTRGDQTITVQTTITSSARIQNKSAGLQLDAVYVMLMDIVTLPFSMTRLDLRKKYLQ